MKCVGDFVLKSIKNKIGYVDNRYLGINKPKGHYVYIRQVNKDGTCDVNVITSLESGPNIYNSKKLYHVRKGNTYPIPVYDSNFKKWSGVTKTPIKNVQIDKIESIGNKKIKRRHIFYIGKFLK